jgi:hypothetical protein
MMNVYKVRCEGGLNADPPELFLVVARTVDEVVALMVGQPSEAMPIKSIEKMFATRVLMAPPGDSVGE